MRFIRKQISITTVIDSEIKGKQEIKDILIKISQGSEDIIFEYRDPRNDFVKRHIATRIKRVYEDFVDIKVIQKGGQFAVTEIPIDNVLGIELITANQNIVVADDEFSRMDLLDLTLPEGE